MANTRKTTTTTKSNDTTKEVKSNVDDKDAKLESLEQQLAEAMKLIAQLGVQSNNKETKNTVEKIDYDELIPVISQCVGKLCLSLDGKGNGTPYEFENFGEVLEIPFGELRTIVKNNKKFATDGLFYIADSKAVKELRLVAAYTKQLSKEDITSLLNKDANTVTSLYELAPDIQKEVIIDMVTDKCANGEKIDANILIALGKLSGKDLINIEKQ
ncbi:MAG: hypothetical protein PHN69_06130 [Candidatus Pacebacteria bacterium]|nr:hypothetical protein [Candidatus Paceibacterota bacterium]